MELKEFDKFLKICRKQGVNEVTFDGIGVKFGEMPRKDQGQDDSEEIESDGISDDEMIFYHLNGGKP